MLRLLALVLPVLAVSYLLVRVVRRAATAAWGVTAGRPRARAALLVAAALLAGLVVHAWQPGSGRYVPVQQGERGTLGAVPQLVARPAVVPVRGAPLRLARAGTPRLAVALVPRDRSAPVLLLADGEDGRAEALLAGAPAQEGELVEARQLAFALPDAPGEDGNQALATGTVDGGTAYDVAYALVWVEDGRPRHRPQRGLRAGHLHPLHHGRGGLPGGAGRRAERRAGARSTRPWRRTAAASSA